MVGVGFWARARTLMALAVAVTAMALPAGVEARVEAPARAAMTFHQMAGLPNIYGIQGSEVTLLTYQQWVSLGSPAPTVQQATYAKYPWSPNIYAVSQFSPRVAELLTFDTWKRVGSPRPSTVASIPGSYVYKWESSPELFVQAPGGGGLHKLTFDEWRAAGSPAPDVFAGQGFIRLTWAPEIAYYVDGNAVTIAYNEWAAEGFPTPLAAPRFEGDRFETFGSNPTIFYSGPVMYRAITYAEWSAAGRPAPMRR